MMKKGDVIIVADDDDDEVRTASQNRLTATLCTEQLFLRTFYSSPLISPEMCGGQDIDVQCDTYRWSWLSFRSQLNLHTPEQGF
jgi:hypothetical protein